MFIIIIIIMNIHIYKIKENFESPSPLNVKKFMFIYTDMDRLMSQKECHIFCLSLQRVSFDGQKEMLQASPFCLEKWPHAPCDDD